MDMRKKNLDASYQNGTVHNKMQKKNDDGEKIHNMPPGGGEVCRAFAHTNTNTHTHTHTDTHTHTHTPTPPPHTPTHARTNTHRHARATKSRRFRSACLR